MIINDDILNWCKEYTGEKFHSLVCDPPYHLTEITLQSMNLSGRTVEQKEYRKTATKGFMGKSWDGGDIAFRKETWEALKEHLYPGAFCFAFASTRGLHRMMVAIEDAGFVIHPTIFLYSFGSGFPKATRIDTQIQSKDEQEVVGKDFRWKNLDIRNGHNREYGSAMYAKEQTERYNKDIYEPTNELAKRWIGHRYGLQALKPSCEPIICFQKRYEGKPVNCIVETGAGALNIDGGRIKIDRNDKNRRPNGSIMQEKANGGNSCFGASGRNPELNGDTLNISKGRWPSNLIIDKECAERFPMTESTDRPNCKGKHYKNKEHYIFQIKEKIMTEDGASGDAGGSAARYFKNVEMKIDAADPVFYASKVSKQERELGCSKIESSFEKGIYGDGLGKTPKVNGIRPTPVINRHPTLKSIDLTTYLATLLLPPLEYAPRRILVPFAGAGSEMIGCLKAGWEEIVGIELTAEYIPIIEARFEYYKKQIELEKSMQLFTPEIMESMKQEKLFE